MAERIETYNMIEVYALLKCGNEIVGVKAAPNPVNGVPDLRVTLEGEAVESDHYQYIGYGAIEHVESVDEAFKAIMAYLRGKKKTGVGK